MLTWAHPDLRAAVVRLNGSGDNSVLSNKLLEHDNVLCRMHVGEGGSDRIGHVSITDNVIWHTEHEAVYVLARFDNDANGHGVLARVDLLRNKRGRRGVRDSVLVRGTEAQSARFVQIRWDSWSPAAATALARRPRRMVVQSIALRCTKR